MLTRRRFLRHALTLGAGAGAATLLAQLTGCAPDAPSNAPSAPPSLTPTALPPSPAAPSTALPFPAIPAPTHAASATAPSLPSATLVRPPTPALAATPAPQGAAYLAVARGDDPAVLARRAVDALGGMARFVKPGQSVLIKPNICVAYHGPEYAATTNPQVVGALVQMCREAGAASVVVLDYPFGGSPDQAYKISQIGDAVRAAGGQMGAVSSLKFRDTPIPDGQEIKRWAVNQDALKADVLIDVPIAKHHNLSRLTLAHKNLMGLVENRERLHSDLAQRLPDLVTLFKPALTIVDAYRMLMANGPTGGRLADVKLEKALIASHDIVAADAYATTLFGLRPQDIGYVKASAERGLGTMDLRAIRIEEITA